MFRNIFSKSCRQFFGNRKISRRWNLFVFRSKWLKSDLDKKLLIVDKKWEKKCFATVYELIILKEIGQKRSTSKFNR